ncbi:MAG: hypothetical protein JNL18_22545 [Planctomycetaceae bacterium]|nr:hypothetical protein [Planctomycetaceae bacterium]
MATPEDWRLDPQAQQLFMATFRDLLPSVDAVYPFKRISSWRRIQNSAVALISVRKVPEKEK